MRWMGSGFLIALGAILMAFCAWFVVFRLVPAYGKMVRTGDGAGFGLGLLMVLWWFVPGLIALVSGGVLLCRAPGSIPAVSWRCGPGLARRWLWRGRCPRFPVCCGGRVGGMC